MVQFLKSLNNLLQQLVAIIFRNTLRTLNVVIYKKGAREVREPRLCDWQVHTKACPSQVQSGYRPQLHALVQLWSRLSPKTQHGNKAKHEALKRFSTKPIADVTLGLHFVFRIIFVPVFNVWLMYGTHQQTTMLMSVMIKEPSAKVWLTDMLTSNNDNLGNRGISSSRLLDEMAKTMYSLLFLGDGFH